MQILRYAAIDYAFASSGATSHAAQQQQKGARGSGRTSWDSQADRNRNVYLFIYFVFLCVCVFFFFV